MERSLTMVVVLGYCLIGGMRLRSQNNGKEAFTMLYVYLMPWSPSLPWYVPFISGNWLSYHGLFSSFFFFFSFFFLLFNFYLIQQFLDPPRKSWLLCFSSLMILSICVDKWNTNKLKMFTMWHHLIFRYSRHTKNGNPFSHIYGGVLSLNSWWRGSTILLYFRSN